MDISRYALWLRLFTLAAVIFVPLIPLACVWLFTQIDFQRLSARAVGWPDVVADILLIVTFIVVPTFLGPWLCAKAIKNSWFFMCNYKLSGTNLLVTDPILRRRRVISLSEVVSDKGFVVFGHTSHYKHGRGHRLGFQDGTSLAVAEALPIWISIEAILDLREEEIQKSLSPSR